MAIKPAMKLYYGKYNDQLYMITEDKVFRLKITDVCGIEYEWQREEAHPADLDYLNSYLYILMGEM